LPQSFTACKSLLTATSAYGLWRRCQSSPQWRYLHRFHIITPVNDLWTVKYSFTKCHKVQINMPYVSAASSLKANILINTLIHGRKQRSYRCSGSVCSALHILRFSAEVLLLLLTSFLCLAKVLPLQDRSRASMLHGQWVMNEPNAR